MDIIDVVLFYTHNNTNFLIDCRGKKYLNDQNLSDQEAELDSKFFFRANRKYIINKKYIYSFRIYERKIKIIFNQEYIDLCIIISKGKISAFKKWIID